MPAASGFRGRTVMTLSPARIALAVGSVTFLSKSVHVWSGPAGPEIDALALVVASGISASTGRPPPDDHPHIGSGSGVSTMNRSRLVVLASPGQRIGAARGRRTASPDRTSTVAALRHTNGAAGSVHEPYDTAVRFGRSSPTAWNGAAIQSLTKPSPDFVESLVTATLPCIPAYRPPTV